MSDDAKKIQKQEITSELKSSYLDYAMSVIVSRALPDVRDGLKPVHRRVLWAMWDSGLNSQAKFRKSANVVGETLGRYHPHGDTAVYDALVRMAQDFSLRYPLIHGQGNFGNIDGDSAAAMRYTEAKLSKVAEEMLVDIEKDTVDWRPNYDATREEPVVVPAKLPNLLLNGTLGIAVGMATNIPPHNLSELSDAIIHIADNPDASSEDLLEFVKGPDFPTGGIMFDKKAIREAYISGKGSITTRAKTEVVERKKNAFDIIITEIPYQVNKADLVRQIADLVQNKKIDGIRDLRDESDREGLRMVIELKNDAPPQKILNQLFKRTNLQKDFHLNMIALVNSIEPRLLSLRDVLHEYVKHRKEVVRRRTEYELRKAEERAHILEGLAKALNDIDKVISIIKKSQDRDDARKNLMGKFSFTEIQANAILEMKLQTLAALEKGKIENELKEKKELIKSLKEILKSPKKLLGIIKKEVKDIKESYGDERRTKVVATGIGEFKDEDLIPNEEAMITISAGGYIKRTSPNVFSSQHRGGKGLIGSDVGEEDFLTHFAKSTTHDDILFFTDRGRVFQTKTYEIPAASRTARGRAIHNFLELSSGEGISALVSYSSKDIKDGYLVMATLGGLVKKTALADFENIRRTGIIAIKLKKGDALKWVRLSSGKDEVIISTEAGQAIRFKEDQIRPMGRTAAGVKGIKLASGDKVAGCDLVSKEDDLKNATLLVAMANGYGKQTLLKEYKVQNRGGTGVKTANITDKTGKLIVGRIVTDEEEMFVLSKMGQIIRTPLKSVRMTGRAAQGVKIMNLKKADSIAAIVIV